MKAWHIKSTTNPWQFTSLGWSIHTFSLQFFLAIILFDFFDAVYILGVCVFVIITYRYSTQWIEMGRLKLVQLLIPCHPIDLGYLLF